jgi:hypothetical protein
MIPKWLAFHRVKKKSRGQRAGLCRKKPFQIQLSTGKTFAQSEPDISPRLSQPARQTGESPLMGLQERA